VKLLALSLDERALILAELDAPPDALAELSRCAPQRAPVARQPHVTRR